MFLAMSNLNGLTIWIRYCTVQGFKLCLADALNRINKSLRFNDMLDPLHDYVNILPQNITLDYWAFQQ